VGYSWASWSLAALDGIEPYEVVQALGADRRWPRQAHGRGGVPVLTFWARTRRGRPLIVAVHRTGDWDWLIVGAREMYAPERMEFIRWEEDQRG
jgi:hypothetical protein